MPPYSTVLALVSLMPAVMGQVATWGQCGGIGYSGSTTCTSGNTCTKLNDYYSQCLPGATVAPTSTVVKPTTPPVSMPTTPPVSTTTLPAGTDTCTTPLPTGGACPATPSTISGFSNSKLPDPFLFSDGTTRVASKADWTCRRNQISALVQGYEAGTLPPKPDSVAGSFASNSLTVKVTQGSTSISFSSTITYPSGTAPAAGWPLLISYGGLSLPVQSGIATMNYNNDNIAQQNDKSSRGIGLFYTLYGKTATASAMTAWAWGVSRIIDALETTPAAKINTQRIGVTGCSRNGKGALTAGALEPRVALTIPQESGSGGDACWRLTAYENQNGGAAQPSTEIVDENVWFSTNFNNYVSNLNALPYDHHMLTAMVAPRALLSYENTDYQWLSPMSSWGCMSAARTVYQALGVTQNHGFVEVGGHSHCDFPSSLQNSLFAFMNKFLLDQSVSTDYFSTNNQFGGPTFTTSQWITWTTPTLS